MQLFFQPDISDIGSLFTFDKQESQHIVKVLRHKEGEVLTLTDGKGFFFKAEITCDDAKKCVARIVSKEKQSPLRHYLHLAVAPTKMNERYEWFLEKATEIGISEITPLICEHSERTVIKEERYEKILVSAMKQSLRAYLPKLNRATQYKDFMASMEKMSAQKFIAHCEKTPKISLVKQLQKQNLSDNIIIMIGPEGDFSSLEIENAIESGFQPISLGNSRLRTETAAIVATHTVAVFESLKM